MPLTDTEIRKAKSAPKPYMMTDGGGLYLWVTPSGGKLWRWGYRHDGKEKLMSHGMYPDVSLLMARKRHSAARTLLADGIDPMALRKAEKTAQRLSSANSFASISALWIEHWKGGKSPRHVDTVRRRMAANIHPHIGERPITQIEAPELVAMAKAIEQRGVSDHAKRALETTGQVFRYAIAHGHASRNPYSDIRPRDVLKPATKTNLARIDAKSFRPCSARLRFVKVHM